MMYNLLGIQLLNDPYMLNGFNDDLRGLVKLAANIMINASSNASARGAIMKILKKKKNEKYKSLLSSCNLSITDMMNKIIHEHEMIARYLNSGIGSKLQNYDSHIANNILNHFTRQGKVSLCVHDSFLVEKRYQDELEEMMKYYYFIRFNYSCGVKIKG
jgi:hypothetical protein